MAKPNHQIRQPASHQNYMANHMRNVSQGFYSSRGPRHAQPRNVVNRNNQSNIPIQIVGMSTEPGNVGQSSSIFPPQHINANGPQPQMFMTGPIASNIHSNHNNTQQAPMYSVNNNQISQITFTTQSGGSSQSQQYFSGYPTPILLPHNIIPFQRPHHAPIPPFCLATPSQPQFHNNPQMTINHVPNTPHQVISGGNDTTPQVVHPTHNIRPPIMSVQSSNTVNNTYRKSRKRPNALMNIVDPATGKNIAEDIYRSAATSPPVKIEKPSIITITHPHSTQNYKRPKVFPKLSITVSPSSTLSTMTSSHSESLSPIPLSTSSRIHSPEKFTTNINNISENQAFSNNDGDNNVQTIEKNGCIETSETDSNSQYNHNHPLTSVSEKHSQPQTDRQNNEQFCHQENESKNILEEPMTVEEKKPEDTVPPKNAEPLMRKNGKSQKKKNKRKSKNRDLNRNRIQNSSTSSEESPSNVQVESSRKDEKETKPTVIPEIKEEEEPVVEISNSIICDQNNIENEQTVQNKPKVKTEPEDYSENTIRIKIEEPIDDQQPKDLKRLEISKEKSLTSSEVKTEKCDIKIDASSLENIVKVKNESVEEDSSSQKTLKSRNILDDNQLFEISGGTFPFEITNSCLINNGPDQCYIRGAYGISFCFTEMFEDIPEPNQNQSHEQQADDKFQSLPHTDNEIEKDLKIEQEYQNNIEVQPESQQKVKIEPESQKDDETEQEQPFIHGIYEIPEPHDNHEEQQTDADIENDEEQNNNNLLENRIEDKRQFIEPPASESCEANSNDVSERKIYSREFLVGIKDTEQCWIRPDLPDVDIVKHNIKRPSRNSPAMPSLRENSHEFLFPSFSRSSFNTKAALTNRRSFQGKTKPNKQPIIHVSLSLNEDVKLRQTENAWKPSLLQKDQSNEENNENALLFKKVRSVLNKLTPEKFDNLVKQLKQLEIKSLEQLKGVIDILFQKAIDEPLYSTYYALMCKELSNKSVSDSKKEETKVDFGKLVLINCQNEFLKILTDEKELNQKAETIEHCEDNDKKKKELELEEERNKTKRRYLGNIKFVGELFKQGMIIERIIIACINTLLETNDEERLESLCKLLMTIGKLLEEKNVSLSAYFESLEQLIHKDRKHKLSSRIRFMIQDIIDLRKNKWVLRRKENNPQTMGQIQKEVETEHINDALLSAPFHYYSSQKEFITPRRDERDNNNDRRRNSGRSNLVDEENGWTSVRSNRSRPGTLSIETSKLKIKAPAAEETTFGNRSAFIFNQTTENKKIVVAQNKYDSLNNIMKNRRSSVFPSNPPKELRPEYRSSWTDGSSSVGENRMSLGLMSSQSSLSISPSVLSTSRTPTPPTPSPTSIDNKSNNKPIDEKKLRNLVKSLLDEISSSDVNLFIKNAQETIEDKFNPQSYPLLIEEALNSVLERNQMERQIFSALIAQLIKDKIIPLSVFQAEFEKLLENTDDLAIDIPQCWKYFAEILTELVVINAHPFIELTRTLAILKNTEKCGKILGELLSILTKEKTPKWVIDNWEQSGLEWINLINSDCEKVDDILEKYNLQFLVKGINNNGGKLSENSMTLEQISEYLLKLLKENNFDDIISWISLNVGEQSKQPQFVRCLVINILKTSIEAIDQSWKLKADTFCKLLPLITRYVDAKRELELQCLYAIQSYNHELTYPQGVLSKIIDLLFEQCVLSDDAFIEWGKTENPNERNGHAVAIKTLTSFFTKLREVEHEDSSE